MIFFVNYFVVYLKKKRQLSDMVLESSFCFHILAAFSSEKLLLCCIEKLIIYMLYTNVWLENLMFLL